MLCHHCVGKEEHPYLSTTLSPGSHCCLLFSLPFKGTGPEVTIPQFENLWVRILMVMVLPIPHSSWDPIHPSLPPLCIHPACFARFPPATTSSHYSHHLTSSNKQGSRKQQVFPSVLLAVTACCLECLLQQALTALRQSVPATRGTSIGRFPAVSIRLGCSGDIVSCWLVQQCCLSSPSFWTQSWSSRLCLFLSDISLLGCLSVLDLFSVFTLSVSW